MDFLYILLYVLVPWTAINLIDYYLVQHGQYDVASLMRADGGVYGRFQWRAMLCYVAGFVIEIPFMSQSLYTGPVARWLGGADISWVVCLLVISPVYYLACGSGATTRPSFLKKRSKKLSSLLSRTN
jgi:NCS1 family nucleobase:cation symporter-1